MNPIKRSASLFHSFSLFALVIIAVLGLQLFEGTHMHADGADHSDCSLCLLSGILKSPSINHVLLKKPLQYIQKIFLTIVSFICIYFRGFLYTPCGPPQA